MGGHIRLSRDITEWGWYKDSYTFRVFFHLLMKANWKEGEYMGHKVGRGSLVTGRKQLAFELDLSEQNIRTAINHLKSTNELTIKTTNRFSIITICKYERWAGEEIIINQQTNQQLTNNQPTTNQQLTTIEENNKEINKENKEYNNNSPAEQEFRQVEKDLRNEIAELKKQLEEAKKERKQRAKPIPKTLGGFARAAFEEFYKGLKGIDYEWSAKDASNMKLLLQKIQHSRENRKVPLDCCDEKMIEALNGFFSYISDPWLLEHLDVANINSKYNEIVAAAKVRKIIQPSMEVGRIITEYNTSKFDNDKTFL